MSTILSVVADFGGLLVLGSTLLLSIGALGVLIAQSPARQQRLGEAALAGVLLYLALAVFPLPRWSAGSRVPLSAATRDDPQDRAADSQHAKHAANDFAANRQASDESSSSSNRASSSPTDSANGSDSADTRRFAESGANRNRDQGHERVASIPASNADSVPTISKDHEIEPTAKIGREEFITTESQAADATAIAPNVVRSTEDIAATHSVSWQTAAAVLYIVVALLLAAWLIAGRIVLWRWSRRAAAADGWLAEVYAELPWSARCQRPRLCVSPDVSRPICFGFWRPTILIPAIDLRQASTDQLRHVLLHELAHASRRDGVGRCLAYLALPALYFHPLYWFLRTRMDFASELLADQWASSHSSSECYAAELVAWARGRLASRQALWGGTSVLRSHSEFYRRMTLLLGRSTPIDLDCSRGWRLTCRAILSASAIALAAVLGIPATNASSTSGTTQAAADKPSAGRLVSGDSAASRIETDDEIGLADTRPPDERYRDAVAIVTRYIERLDRDGATARAAAIRQTLLEVQDQYAAAADGDERRSKADDSARSAAEAHLISIIKGEPLPLSEMGRVAVEVTQANRPVVLVLLSREATQWQVKVAPGARVDRVLVSAGRQCEVIGLPSGTNIMRLSLPSGDLLNHISGRFSVISRLAAQWRVREAVGLPLTTIASQDEWDGKPIVVGPANADWRAQRAVNALAPLRAEAEQSERLANRPQLADLRFPIVHRVRRGGPYYETSYATSFGEATIDGVDATSLTPVTSKLGQFARDSAGQVYSIIEGHAVVGDLRSAVQQPILNGDTPAQLSDAQAIAYHEAGKSLLVWGNYAYRYDASSGVWSVTPGKSPRMAAAAYLPRDRAVYGLEVESKPSTDSTRILVRLLKFDAAGTCVSQVALPQPLLAQGVVQMAAARDYLAVVRPSIIPSDSGASAATIPGRLFLLEPASGRIVWTSLLTPVGDAAPTPPKETPPADVASLDHARLAEQQIASQVVGMIGNGMVDPRSPSARLKQRFAEMEKAITALRATASGRADLLAADLANLKKQLDGDYASLAKDDKQPELHVVSSSKGRSVPLKSLTEIDVVVSYTQRPVVLALLGYDAIQWNVKVADGVKLERVILSGYYKGSKVTGFESLSKPPTVEVYEGNSESNSIRYIFPDRRQLDGDLPTVGRLRELTGLEIATITGEYNYRGVPFQVGPSDASWRTQHVLHLSTPLYREIIRPSREKMWAEVSNLRFAAVHRTDSDDRGEGRFRGDAGQRSYALYTPAGPLAESIIPFNQPLRNIAVDPWSEMVYGVTDKSVFVVNPKSGNCEPMTFTASDAPIDGARAVAFDGKRRRLLVWGKELYAYDVLAKTWSHRRHSGQSLLAATYSVDDDVIYAVEGATEENSVREAQSISRINSNGALIDRVPLSHRIWLGYYEGSAQLALAGGRLVLTTPGGLPRSTDAASNRQRCYTIDRKSGDVTWSSFATPIQSKEKK